MATEGRSIVFATAEGARLRVTPYGEGMIRVQAVRRGEEFFPDDRTAMVEQHAWDGVFSVRAGPASIILRTPGRGILTLLVGRNPLRLSFREHGVRGALLKERGGVRWEGEIVRESFDAEPAEHFTGLGHGFFGRAESIDLRGSSVERNYGAAHGDQAPLIVPFYLSSRGYGVFVNSTFPNSFSFGHDGTYGFSLRGRAQMDFFVIAGPAFPSILDRYTQLTGRPRIPPLAAFGLGLSDKGNDEKSPDPSDEAWWKRKIGAHRGAGYPIDHVINDNRWRAGGGQRCESFFAWDSTRYPDPAEYERWVKALGLFVTIDFNRCVASKSEGWEQAFNMPATAGVDHGESAPDFTRPEVRRWFWTLQWNKSLDPALAYPGDALWIDEFDELGKIPDGTILGNGRSWGEMKNSWFLLIARALVEEGWDRHLAPASRPFVWVRGMTAGGQRYATLWSGDIRPTYAEMRGQVRAMQLAGLSGFPFWGHDAGGFFDWTAARGPDEPMYRRWSMEMGSFSPFWKPHGMGRSRWPLDRDSASQAAAHACLGLRYRLLPYTYSCAREASERGTPVARAMVLDHQHDAMAWTHDLQYMWGGDLLVAPRCSDSAEGESTAVWLPPGDWYGYWDDARIAGGRSIRYRAPGEMIPLFVRAGSIIPTAPEALSTAFLRRDTLIVHVYAGGDGRFSLYEDDGVSEAYRTGQSRSTEITFRARTMTLTLSPARGSYAGAPERRTVRAVFHGFALPRSVSVNGSVTGKNALSREGRTFSVDAPALPAGEELSMTLEIKAHQNNPGRQ